MVAHFPTVQLLFENIPSPPPSYRRSIGTRADPWFPATTEDHEAISQLLLEEGIPASPVPQGYPRSEMGGLDPLIALSVVLIPFLKAWQEELAKDSYVGLKRFIGKLYERWRQRFERGGVWTCPLRPLLAWSYTTLASTTVFSLRLTPQSRRMKRFPNTSRPLHSYGDLATGACGTTRFVIGDSSSLLNAAGILSTMYMNGLPVGGTKTK